MNVYLLRGLPGAGKDFTIDNLTKDMDSSEYIVCSADHYFIDESGKYNFDHNLLGKAHGACRYKFVKGLEDKIPNVFVSNTNTKYSELRDYVVWGASAGYVVKLVESSAPWARDVNECFKRNTHGVPIESLRAMKQRYQSNDEIARFCMENLGVKVEWE